MPPVLAYEKRARALTCASRERSHLYYFNFEHQQVSTQPRSVTTALPYVHVQSSLSPSSDILMRVFVLLLLRLAVAHTFRSKIELTEAWKYETMKQAGESRCK